MACSLRSWLLVLLACSACGGSTGSTTPSPAPASRNLGSFTVSTLRFEVLAERELLHRDPCEPTFLRSRACTDATIRTSLVNPADPGVAPAFGFDPGWDSTERIIVAERDGGSARRIEARLDETFTALSLVACTDDAHAAYRLRWNDDTQDLRWHFVAVVQGVAFGFDGSPATASCEVALAAGRRFDERFATALAAGDRHVFDAFVRGGALASAIDFALAHPFEVDALREPYPLVDELFFHALEEAMPDDSVLVAHLARRLTDENAAYPEGLRRNDSLEAFVTKLVRLLPEVTRQALAIAVASRCGRSPRTCPSWSRAVVDQR